MQSHLACACYGLQQLQGATRPFASYVAKGDFALLPCARCCRLASSIDCHISRLNKYGTLLTIFCWCSAAGLEQFDAHMQQQPCRSLSIRFAILLATFQASVARELRASSSYSSSGSSSSSSSSLPSQWITGIATNYGGPSEGKDPSSPSFGTSDVRHLLDHCTYHIRAAATSNT